MMAKCKSFGLIGINGYVIETEVDINQSLPSFDIVGLGDTAIKESKERVRSAIKNSGLVYPHNKITVNLAPADIKKEGAIYDLPIAITLLTATEQIHNNAINTFIIIGELALDGSVRGINGVLPILIEAKKLGYKNFIIPQKNNNEARYISDINTYAVSSLREAVDFLNGVGNTPKSQAVRFDSQNVFSKNAVDFCFVKGQQSAKRALEIAVSGGHNILMIGPPGSGKTMLAKCVPTIMPNMSFEEALEVTKIHSIKGMLNDNEGILKTRPFRSPHHTASTISLTGGGKNSAPGEISLSHNGVLFLDEVPEYSRHSLETLRQPLEDGVIVVSRASCSVEYPANFMLVASMNPCPCGNYGSKNAECKCSPTQINKYLSKLSGPLLDRIDLHIEVDGVEYSEIADDSLAESSEQIKKRIDAARTVQLDRFADKNYYNNAKMSGEDILKYCHLDDECKNILKLAFEKLNLSARAYNRIIKVARTIADLEGNEKIKRSHITEAIQYRTLDRKYWSK